MDTNNTINDNSCKNRMTTQDGFLAEGQISRSLDGKGINSCPNLHAMTKFTKNICVLHNMDKCDKKACPASQSCAKDSELSK